MRLPFTFDHITKNIIKKTNEVEYELVDAGCGCCGDSAILEKCDDHIEDLKEFIETMESQITLAEEAIEYLSK